MGKDTLAQVFREQGQVQAFSTVGLRMRLAAVESMFLAAWDPTGGLVGVARWFTDGLTLRMVVVTAALAVTAAGTPDVAVRRERSIVANWYRENRGEPLAVLFLAVWTAGAVVLLYLSFLSPVHAMSARYLAASWPLLAFVPVIILRVVSRGVTVLTLAYGLIVLLPADVEVIRQAGAQRPFGALFGPEKRVVMDNLARGILPRAVDLLADQTQVYAAWQEDLLRTPDAWLRALRPGDVVISAAPYQPYHVHDLLERVRTRYPVELFLSPFPTPGFIFVLRGAPTSDPH
jgi:hypothetical protein